MLAHPAYRARTVYGGQALIPALLLLSLCGVAWVALYNLGQVAAARARLTHAADAAVYSAALEQTRTLNLLAYINRAQIAHQVAMAHLVTLATWAKFSDTEAQRRAMGNPPTYLIGSLFGTKAQRSYSAGRPSGGAAHEAARAYQAHDDLVYGTLLHAAQQAVATLPRQREAMIQAILRANYPELQGQPQSLQWRVLSDGWPGYVRSRSGQALRPLAYAAVGRYDFLQPRNFTRTNNWIVQKACPQKRHELRRRGETRMDGDGNWSSFDSLSYHSLRWNKWIGCYYREYPMGWGLAGDRLGGDTVQRAPEDFSSQDFWRWVSANTSWNIFSGVSNPLADAYAWMESVSPRGRGLPDSHEVSSAGETAPLRFAIAVRQQAASLPVSGGASRIAWAGAYALRVFQPGDGLTVNAAAETYFVRPQPRGDGKNEKPTLFRPYWQAHRVAANAGEQFMAHGATR
ncbi:pilus assembly protein TadG-related protein [Bordetella sp. FB-8]|uniref:pilus assembly protein TadG-related protein n=1 Tax=Bordetella sp. FB-8 TaxID=1159870 RepID=UPI00036058CF|nr:pilus assembly protein TadG-related protein [Bordetella sp. FB-8]